MKRITNLMSDHDSIVLLVYGVGILVPIWAAYWLFLGGVSFFFGTIEFRTGFVASFAAALLTFAILMIVILVGASGAHVEDDSTELDD